MPSSALPSTYNFTFDSNASIERPKFELHQRRSTSEPPTIGSSPPVIPEPSGLMPGVHARTPDPNDVGSSSINTLQRHQPLQIPNFPKRPALPVSAVPSPLGSPALGYPPGTSPLASPRLATYRPPEELGEESPAITLGANAKGKGKARAVDDAGEQGDTIGMRSQVERNEDVNALGLGELDRYFPLATVDTPSWMKDRGNDGQVPALASPKQESVFAMAQRPAEAGSSAVAAATSSNSDDDDDDGSPDDELSGPPKGSQRVVEIEDVIEPDAVEEELDGDPDIDEDDEDVDGEGIIVALVPGGANGPDEERARLAEEVDRMEEELRELQRERAELEQMEAMLEEDGEMDGMMEGES
jgi:hypothetical protein